MIPNHVRNIVYVTVCLTCAVGYGEELPDLINRLQKLDGKNPIRGIVSIEDRTPKTKETGSLQIEKANVTITADANALSLTFAGHITNNRIFREFSLLRAGELVHYGPPLARELDGLKLVEILPGSHEGVPCNRWRLESEETQSKLGASSTRRRDVELWIDAEGYPLAASFKTLRKGKMLFIKMSSESVREQRYRRLGDRLILILDKNETDIKMKSGSEKQIVTTTVEVKND